MTSRRIHTNTSIFFPSPNVVRIEFGDGPVDVYSEIFRKICRKVYKNTTGTWGHSQLKIEWVEHANYGHEPDTIGALFHHSMKYIPRAYFCFAKEADMLQFMLQTDARCTKVKMWPSTTKFTIHEYLES